MHIGIAEEQPFAGGELRTAMQRVDLAEPAGRQVVDVQYAHAGVSRGEPVH